MKIIMGLFMSLMVMTCNSSSSLKSPDRTCGYACQITEYFYWGMTSKLGAQVNRKMEINEEWRLHTQALFEAQDTALNQLLSDAQYGFPSKLPNGEYQP